MWSMLGSPALALPAVLAFVPLMAVAALLAWDRPPLRSMWPELASAVVCLALLACVVAGGDQIARLALVAAGFGVLVIARMHRTSALSLVSVLVPAALVGSGALSVPACLWLMAAYCALRVMLRAGAPMEVRHA